jgi:hypothetical protein
VCYRAPSPTRKFRKGSRAKFKVDDGPMAKKRRTKRRKVTSQRQQQPTQTTMPVSEDQDSVDQERLSSDGTLSDIDQSEDAQTDMTSILEPDENENGEGEMEMEMEVDTDEDDDGGSTYAISHYPRINEAYRTETLYPGRHEYDTELYGTPLSSMLAVL